MGEVSDAFREAAKRFIAPVPGAADGCDHTKAQHGTVFGVGRRHACGWCGNHRCPACCWWACWIETWSVVGNLMAKYGNRPRRDVDF